MKKEEASFINKENRSLIPIITSCKSGKLSGITEESQKLLEIIKFRSRQFTEDQFSIPKDIDYLRIESAMLIGASIAIELAAEDKKD